MYRSLLNPNVNKPTVNLEPMGETGAPIVYLVLSNYQFMYDAGAVCCVLRTLILQRYV